MISRIISNSIIGITICLCANGTAAQTTQRFTANKASEYAIVYSLPLTALDVTVETSHSVEDPGEFVNYARRHLGISDAIRSPRNTVAIKSITIIPRGVPDPDNRWQIQFKNGSQVSMLMTDAGIPLALNLDEVEQPEVPALPTAVAPEPTPLQRDAARQAVTLDISRATSAAKKAELTAQRIFELREQRGEIISGNADNMPPDGDAIKVALEELNAQEAALTAMFTGTRQTFTNVNTVTFIPGESDTSGVVIARISPLEGIVQPNDLSGIPLTLDMTVNERATLPVNEKGEAKRFPKGGVAYTIPGTATITLSFNGKKVASQTFPLAQLGVTFGIDPNLFTDKKSPAFVEFSPSTGAITRLDTVTIQAK